MGPNHAHVTKENITNEVLIIEVQFIDISIIQILWNYKYFMCIFIPLPFQQKYFFWDVSTFYLVGCQLRWFCSAASISIRNIFQNPSVSIPKRS